MLETKWSTYCADRGWTVERSDDLVALRHPLLDGYYVRARQPMGIDGDLVWAFFCGVNDSETPIRPYPLGMVERQS